MSLTTKLGGLGGTSMENRKDEILAKSRELKKDEGMEFAENRGNRLSEYTVGIFGTVVASFALLNQEFAAAWAALLIVAVFGFGFFLSIFRFTKRKIHLLITIWSFGTIIFFLALFLAAIYGWWIF
jgi:lipopolysaccharide export LptBFGC system permease protein LptF